MRRKVGEQSQEIEGIVAAGERASTLTRQLLSFSRRRVIKPAVLNVNDVVRGLENVLQRVVGENMKLESRSARYLAQVLADSGQIEQVVLNLAVNARDAMKQGGTLTIRTDLAHGADGCMHAVLRVSDTGHGMDTETQRHIFEPFFTTKPIGEGTGLGLAKMVYGMVAQSGGTISVKSAPEQRLQLRDPTATGGRGRGGGGTIALADARPGAWRGYRPVGGRRKERAHDHRTDLARRGYRVLVASDGDEALRLGFAHLRE